MLPTFDQIQRAAYFRWQRRGGEHGLDHSDWLGAEQELLFALNYEVVAHHRLDGGPARFLGTEGRRKCRFCELAAPQTAFEKARLALPAFLGNESLFALDQCDECGSLFAESIDGDLERFARPLLHRAPGANRSSAHTGGNGVPAVRL